MRYTDIYAKLSEAEGLEFTAELIRVGFYQGIKTLFYANEKEILLGAFSWHASKKGWDYWNNIFEKLN